MKALMLAALTGALAAPFAARAEPLKGCYIRIYDADHLAKNPRQIIRRIQFERVEGAGPASYGVQAYLKNDKRIWDAGGSCKPEGAALLCELDGDSGHIRATPDGEKLSLDVIDEIGFEADKKNGDLDRKTFRDEAHKSFILSRANAAECNYRGPR
jgi:hypothetical protein